MKNLVLYSKYAWRSIQRGGQRSFFAILCIAVGVASIVALQTTGLSIQDTVAGDARANARADVVVTSRQDLFSQEDLTKFETLKQNKEIVDYTTSAGHNGISVKKPDGSRSNDFGSFYVTFVIDPTKYPFYGKVEFAEPQGKSLKDVLTGPGQVVLNSKMAKSIGAKVGDKIKATGNTEPGELTVTGILTEKTASPDSGQAEFTGYGYTNTETGKQLFRPENLLPATIYVKTNSTKEADDKARDSIKNLSKVYVAQTSAELNDTTKQATKGLSDLLSYVGLLSLLIGSVGVVNTMLVVVGRRSTEIATIKALGMEAGQTVQVFMIESAILGIIGSIVGLILGLGLSLIVNQAAGGFVNQTIETHFYAQPLIIGAVVGIITAIVFGLLPAYSASKIPPAQVLRQKINALPRISIWATLLIIVVMTAIMGLLAGLVLGGNFLTGVIVAFGTLVACTLLVLLFSGILWVVGKIPLPFGLNYKMARRNLSRGRAKSATTMLVMMVGIFSMALVFILASSLKDTIRVSLEQSFGYNVQMTATDDVQTADIKKGLDSKQVPGLEKYLETSGARIRLVSAGGADINALVARKIKKEEEAAQQGGGNNNRGGGGADLSILVGINPNNFLNLAKLTEGQVFNNENQLIIGKETRDNYGLKVGDEVVFQDLATGKPFSLTISGVFEPKNLLVNLGSMVTSYARMQAIPGHQNEFNLTVERDRVDQAVKYLEANYKNADVTDLSFIVNVINRLVDNITAFPVLLAFLSLIAGAVLIANNVALAVLERRTEMGVMKSIGADNGRVMAIINWETAIVGFLGGLIGLGLAATLASVLVGFLGTADNPAVLSISPILTLGLLALSVGLALAATIGSAWGAAHEKPLVVLRYE